MKRISLTWLLVIFALVVSLLPITGMFVLVVDESSKIVEMSDSKLDTLAAGMAQQSVSDIIKTCEIISNTRFDALRRSQVEVLSKLAESDSARILPDSVSIKAVGRDGLNEPKHFDVHALHAIGFDIVAALDKNGTIIASQGKHSTFFSALKSEYALEYSVFVRASKEGDFVRIYDTFPSEKNDVRKNIYIACDGSDYDAAVSKSLLAKRPYKGSINTENSDFNEYLTPVVDSDGEVIGAVGCYQKRISPEEFTGYFSGWKKGKNTCVWGAVIAPDGKLSKLASSEKLGNENIVEKISLMAEQTYSSAEKQSRTVRMDDDGRCFYAGAAYFEDWNIVFGALICADNFAPLKKDVERRCGTFVRTLIPISLAVLAFAIFTAAFAGRKGASMILKISEAADSVSKFELSKASKILSRDVLSGKIINLEIFELALSLKKMAERISLFLKHVEIGGEELAERAKKISDTTGFLESEALSRGKIISELSFSAKSMEQEVKRLSEYAKSVSAQTQAAIPVAVESGKKLGALDKSAKAIVSATEAARGILSIISEGAERILSATSETAALSSRTAMLSKNASREVRESSTSSISGAFKEVADEIGLFSKNAAEAAAEAASKALSIRDDTAREAAEMLSHNTAARNGVLPMGRISHVVKSVGTRAERLDSEIDSLARAINDGSGDILKISEALAQLSDCIGKTLSALSQLKELSADISKGEKSDIS